MSRGAHRGREEDARFRFNNPANLLRVLYPRNTVSHDVQTRFSVQLAFAKFLSKIKGNFGGSAVSMILALH